MRLPLISCLLLLVAFFAVQSDTSAQVNNKGTIHVAVGAGIGGFGTTFEQTFNVFGANIVSKTRDAAISVTVPIEVQLGIGSNFSLGVYVEPGAYLDSNATRSNGLFAGGLKPEFYLAQKDRFALYVNGKLGFSRLSLDDTDENDALVSFKYSGIQFGLGGGIGLYFTDHIGLKLGLSWLSTHFGLKEFSIQDQEAVIVNDPRPKLTANGAQLNAQLAFKF